MCQIWEYWNHWIIPPNSCGAICLLSYIIIYSVCILCKAILIINEFHRLRIWAIAKHYSGLILIITTFTETRKTQHQLFYKKRSVIIVYLTFRSHSASIVDTSVICLHDSPNKKYLKYIEYHQSCNINCTSAGYKIVESLSCWSSRVKTTSLFSA